MNFKRALLGGVVAMMAAVPASASTVVLTKCVSVADAAGCLFDGNINQQSNPANVNGYVNAQNAYNAVRDPDIVLKYLTDNTAANFGTFGSITGAGTAAGSWTLGGYNVEYIAVKASNQFVLYKVSGSTGLWDTLDIPYLNKQGKGNPHALSHLVFFGTAAVNPVPEPSAWALFVVGFGTLGASMRRRRQALRLA